jgi:hypothetical protein
MDIFKLANDIANNISEDDKAAIENMDMEKMISHVTQNVFKMMNGNDNMEINTFNLIPPELLNTINKTMKIVENENKEE